MAEGRLVVGSEQRVKSCWDVTSFYTSFGRGGWGCQAGWDAKHTGMVAAWPRGPGPEIKQV